MPRETLTPATEARVPSSAEQPLLQHIGDTQLLARDGLSGLQTSHRAPFKPSVKLLLLLAIGAPCGVLAIVYSAAKTGCRHGPCEYGATCTPSGGHRACACAVGWARPDCGTCASSWQGANCSVALRPQGKFNQPCVHVHGEAGWPRFNTPAELAASPGWARYFQTIYGETPSTFPLCTFDLWWIDNELLQTTNATPHPSVLKPDRVQVLFDDTLHSWEDGDYFKKKTNFDMTYYDSDNGGGYAIYHSSREGLYANSHQWIEVIHKCGSSNCGTGVTGESDAMWFSHAPGSGIWYYTGKHALFNTHAEAAMALCGQMTDDDGTARCARRHGLDSYSFRTNHEYPKGLAYFLHAQGAHPSSYVLPTFNGTLSTWGMVALYELVGLRGPGGIELTGKYTCGTATDGTEGGFRAGWRASRPCHCMNSGTTKRPNWLNCGEW